jgi:hypothetical protein
MAGGREVSDRRRDFKAGRIGCAGGAGARSKRQPNIQLAPAQLSMLLEGIDWWRPALGARSE